MSVAEPITIPGASRLRGSIKAVPSKSHTHRAIVAASLSTESSEIRTPSQCEDVKATINAVTAYGTEVLRRNDSLIVRGSDRIKTPCDVVNCRESASTMRFVTPILAHAQGISVLTGARSLRGRPMQPLIDSLEQLGVRCYSTSNNGQAPIVIFGGTYRGGRTGVAGNVSSQFISGLLFSGSIAAQDTWIEVTTAIESAPYVKMTLRLLRSHDVAIETSPDLTEFHIPGGQSVSPHSHSIEGDYSSAAFLLAGAAITKSKVCISGLKGSDSLQGDERIVSILREMGSEIHIRNDSVCIEPSSLKAIEIDARDCPDLVPPIAATACYAEGVTRILNAQRLRTKESDRLAALSSELQRMRANIHQTDNGLEIVGVDKMTGSRVNSHNDHRIAMACAVAALAAEGDTVLKGASCVTKSYPTFFDDLRELGVEIHAGK